MWSPFFIFDRIVRIFRIEILLIMSIIRAGLEADMAVLNRN